MRRSEYHTLILLFLSLNVVLGQKIEKLNAPLTLHYCPIGEPHEGHYVPARKIKKNKRATSSFEVTYAGNPPSAAKQALEGTAIPILESLITSQIPIRLHMNWTQLDQGKLAAAAPTTYYNGNLLTPLPGRVYPVALMEKILRLNINDLDPDIYIEVNSEENWSLNPDATPQEVGRRFDFVSVMLHEIIHGLGFSGRIFFDEDSKSALYNSFEGGAHTAFADHIIHMGNPLDSIIDNSVEMGSAITSERLLFRKRNGRTERLFAPRVYDEGSSVSHLDQNSYESSPSSLMVPFLSQGKIERDPGVALEMLYDMGWDMTYLLHTQQDDGSDNFAEDYAPIVQIISDNPVDTGSLLLIYSSDNFTTQDTTSTEAVGQNIFSGTIPAPLNPVIYQYYFSIVDGRGNIVTGPGDAPKFFFRYEYGQDTTPPVIEHTPLLSLNERKNDFLVEAAVTDHFSGVDTVFIEWFINDQEMLPKGMILKKGFDGERLPGQYESTIFIPNSGIQAGDTIKYRIIAKDLSQLSNIAFSPTNNGYYDIAVQEVTPIESYKNEFETETEDFEGEGFSVNIAAGFNSAAINSSHPYPEAGSNNFFNFSYELTSPVIINSENPIISFDEIAIIEPGDAGTSFGDDNFWDYVIVEGLKVGTSEWLPFLEGYDCNAHASWRGRYNSSPNTASPSLYKERVIDMTQNGNFSAGDEVFIRFRLFSDPAVAGWGWAIDNLFIQEERTTPVIDFVIDEKITLAPVPANDLLNVRFASTGKANEVGLTIFNTTGQQVYRRTLPIRGRSFDEQISTSQFAEGVYFMKLTFEEGETTTRKFIIQR